jgi:curli biogenesis system outer membrane secretion channel CsgG
MALRGTQAGLVLVAAAFLLGGCGGASIEAQFSPEFKEKKSMTVAVLPFEQSEPPSGHQEMLWMLVFAKDTGNMASDAFTTELMRVPRFKVVERSQLKKILAEQDLSLSQLLAKKSAQEIGHLLGVDAVVMGTVGPVGVGTTFLPGSGGCSFSYSMRMVDTTTGTVLVSTNVHAQFSGGEMDVAKRFHESVQGVVDKIIATVEKAR